MTITFDKTKLTKSLAQNKILVPLLDRAFDSFDEPWVFQYEGKEKDDAWHPSGDCTPTVSTLYKKARQGSERITGPILKSFMVGHYWHQLIQHVMVHKMEIVGADCIERVAIKGWSDEIYGGKSPYKAYHWVRGQGDIVPLETKRWRGLVDIKTIGGEQFKICKDTRRLPVRFEAKYKAQLNIYMDLFNEDRALILGVNKDSPHDFMEFELQRDQKLIDAIYDKWQFVSLCLTRGRPPTASDDKQYVLPK